MQPHSKEPCSGPNCAAVDSCRRGCALSFQWSLLLLEKDTGMARESVKGPPYTVRSVMHRASAAMTSCCPAQASECPDNLPTLNDYGLLTGSRQN